MSVNLTAEGIGGNQRESAVFPGDLSEHWQMKSKRVIFDMP